MTGWVAEGIRKGSGEHETKMREAGGQSLMLAAFTVDSVRCACSCRLLSFLAGLLYYETLCRSETCSLHYLPLCPRPDDLLHAFSHAIIHYVEGFPCRKFKRLGP